ncbi:hypothetical protein J437_LFUL015830 [Ladona fulva]|uniref:Gag-like protein n=1 Tax=Ladona fulva TaxID=123851 RepID=A0A8K0P5K3_LADFU|nr:hypothetical protein J437_LFUL015830 [Ladona fulva]
MAKKFFDRLTTREAPHLQRLADDIPLPWDFFPHTISSTATEESKPARKYRKKVIKGLPADTAEGEIFEDLDAQGIPVQKVHQLQTKGGEKNALFQFAAPSCPEWTPTKIVNLNSLGYCRISIRRYCHEGPQMCHRCGRFVHLADHCFVVPRCFRCPGPHLVDTCHLTKDD